MRSVPIRSYALLSLICAVSLSRPAAAETPDAKQPIAEPPGSSSAERNAPEARRVRIGAGTGLIMGPGDVSTSRDDVVSTQGSLSFWQLTLEPMYWIASDFALGVRTATGFEPGTRGVASSSGEQLVLGRQLWQVAAAGRYQPDAGRSWYVSAHVGTAGIIDSAGNDSVSQWTPLVGAALGYDLRVAEPVALGFELQAAYAQFGESDPLPAIGSIRYEMSGWLGVAIVGNLLL